MRVGQDREAPAAARLGERAGMGEQAPADASAHRGRLDVEQDQLDRPRRVRLADLMQADRPVAGIGRDEDLPGGDRGGRDRKRLAALLEEIRRIAPMGLGAEAQAG